MTENNPTNILSAFEMLCEGIEAEIDFINGIGAKSFEARGYTKAKAALEYSGTMTEFQKRVAALHNEWKQMASSAKRVEDAETRIQRSNLGKLRKGGRTPEFEYYESILKAPAESGGTGKVSEVLDRVVQIMKSVLKKADYQPLASNPDTPRWHNAAQWARNSMVR